MRKIYLAIVAVLFHLVAISQTDIIIGSGGTTGNSGTSYPSPLQDYYEGGRAQYLFLASELTSAGMGPGYISSIKYEVTSLNNFSGTIEQFSMAIGTTTTGSLTSSSWESGTLGVYGPVDYVTTLGTNIFNFSSPFFWNGTDNIVVEVCNGDPNNSTYVSYTENATVPWTTGLAFNGSHTYRADNLGNLCGSSTTTNSGTQTTRPDITFEWTPASTTGCYLPSGTGISNITSTSASATWTPSTSGTPASGYNWELRTSGAPGSGSTGLVTSGNTATTSANFSSLTPSTNYAFYIQSNCGSGSLSLWSGAYNFITSCAPIPAFSENFNSVTVPSLPLCWSSIIRGSTIGSATVTTTAANTYSAPNAVTIYNSSSTSTDDIILVSPPVSNLTAGTYQLSFYASNSALGQDVEIGTLDNNSPTAVFTPLQTVVIGTGYNKYSVSFAGYAGTDSYIGIRNSNTTTFTYVYLDDISWELIPSCVEPNTLVVSNTANTTAQLDWAAPSSSTPSSYDVYYATNNTPPVATTTPSASGIIGTTYNFTGLQPSATYYVWVRSNCGSGGVSAWSSVATFVTLCGAVTDFYENFDGVTVPALPNCWFKVGTGGLARTQATNPQSSPNTMYIYGTSTTSQAVVSMIPVSNAGDNTHQLRFSARGNFTAGATIQVGYLTDPADATTFVSLQDNVASTLTYQSFTVIPGSINPGSNTVFAFRHTGAAAYSVLIDDVYWEAIPSCIEPTALVISNISTTSAQVDWTAPSAGSPASYDVYYSTSNTPPTGTTAPTAPGITATTYNFTALASATHYFVWVRSNCGTGGYSSWSIADSFYTACNATNIPYTQDFETAIVPGMPNCTSTENVGTGNNWVTINNPGYGFTTNTLEYVYNSTNPADTWFYTQGLTLTAGISYTLKFNYGNNSTTYVESMNVSYGTSPSASSMTDLIVDYPSITGAVANSSSTDFTPTTTGVYYLGFHAYSIVNQYYLYVDDISVTLTPSCVEPTAVIASNITYNTAQVDWTAPSTGTPASYDVYVSTSNTVPTSTTTPTASGITGTSYNLTSLSASTQYYVWVRSNCGTGGVSVWSVTYSFYTQCDTTGVPYTQNFESATVPGLPSCTTIENVGTGNNWVTINSPGYGFANNTLEYAYNTTNPADAWFYTAGLNLTAGISYRLSFNYGNNSTAYVESMNVSYGSNPSAASMTNLIVDYPSITGGTTTSTPTASATDFIPAASGVYYIGFHAYSIANQYNLFVDDITVALTSTYPVSFTSFKGEKQGAKNLLTWTTASEQNNKGYELQRSSNGSEFSTIAFVQSKGSNGTSNSALTYNYADEKPLSANNYYRLKQVDFDGKSTLSNIVLIKGIKPTSIVLSSVYPNPAKNQLNVIMSAPANDKVSMVVTDIAGKIVIAAIHTIDQRRQQT